MSGNGQLRDSELAAIAGGGRLRRDAAVAWNAMDVEARRRGWGGLAPVDSYRILGRPGDFGRGRWSQWAAWERMQRGGNLAARPGTSNHGWGLAVDVTRRTRWIIDQIGSRYGWAKRWSDAPGEWWHIRYRPGVWKKPERDRLWFLTSNERRMVREYLRLRKAGRNRRRRGELWRALIRQRKAIWRAAERSGWDKHRRRARYRFLSRFTRSS